ncbi:Rpn family recombination-promoting nuclease/putative transposase [Synechococcales cyanobacterium C]|uniref:Rpn family recombination-promoting nuclease/putative transposase n=1 Tax=Petrachloros mirabilis ULC683 TaxID=2781853 RepID=A0A8K2A6Q8_9CYAN|nr:Rpn family recombination-promoting nuclease/putative transposase [Petrachloros mirabilis]NCJ06259.1 Rpn family recombination-promoting nuclease/putative transposase [Petrachloros mirabilis ULC683]
MRRDSIFYKLFAQLPLLLFELLPNPPVNATAYSFDSVAVKEPRFEIDGVFVPPENEIGTVYFCEVQFQKDQQLYERVAAESLLYFYRNRTRFHDWQVVIIYPSRSVEQSQTHPYQELLESHRIHRVYLDELGEIRTLPLWLAVMVLTTVEEGRAAEEARYLLNRSRQEGAESSGRGIIELITTILAYRFDQLSRREIEAMLDITLQETRVYREIKEEGRKEGREEGREEGRQQEAVSFVMRLLTRRFGELPKGVRVQIEALSLEQLEALGEALLDFVGVDELVEWLAEAG